MFSKLKHVIIIFLIGTVILIDCKKDPTSTEVDQFFKAVVKAADDTEALQKVKDMITNLNIINKSCNSNDYYENKKTALHFAIQRPWNPEVVGLLLDHGANIQAEDIRKETPLFGAVMSDDNSSTAVEKRIEIVRKILENAQKIGIAKQVANAKGWNDIPLIYYACVGGLEEIVRLLLENGADVYATKWNPLLRVIDMVKGKAFILKFYASVREKELESAKYLKIVKLILTMRPDVDLNSRTLTGETPLFRAVANEHKELVELLLRHEGKHKVDIVRSKMTPQELSKLFEDTREKAVEVNAKLDKIAEGKPWQ